jgi:hypothetical protein
MIQTSFWTDAKVMDEMTPEDKYFYLYLMTNPHTKQCGCYEISKRQISNETGYNLQTVERLIDRFENYLCVIFYNEETREIFLTNWHKYNWTKSPKVMSCIKKEMQNIKSDEFKYALETLCIDYGYPMDTLSIDLGEKEKEKEKEKEYIKDIPAPKKPIKNKFGEFQSVSLTEDEYKKLLDKLGQTVAEDLINRLDGYKASTGKRYKSDYATILNWSRKEPIKTAQQIKPNKFHNFIQSDEKVDLNALAEQRKEEVIKNLRKEG